MLKSSSSLVLNSDTVSTSNVSEVVEEGQVNSGYGQVHAGVPEKRRHTFFHFNSSPSNSVNIQDFDFFKPFFKPLFYKILVRSKLNRLYVCRKPSYRPISICVPFKFANIHVQWVRYTRLEVKFWCFYTETFEFGAMIF